MRQVLFRGKSIKTNRWHYGYYACNGDSHYIIFGFGTDAQSMKVEVIPETVGEFTGLCDINHKPIFEGDIVKPDGDYCYFMYPLEAVEYQNGGFSPFSIYGCEEVADGEMSEVVGNIIDNPELLVQQAELLAQEAKAKGGSIPPMPEPKYHTDIRYDEAAGREVVTITRIAPPEEE